MTAPVQHHTDVYVDHSATGVAYWRARCTCGWKSARYTQKLTARAHEERHNELVAAGEWAGGAA